MLPTPRTTLGLKGHRPMVGNLASHDLTDVVGALKRVTGRLTTRLIARGRAQGRRGKTPARLRHMQAACARHLRDRGRAYPAARYPPVGLVIDNAPWHRGGLLTTGLAPGAAAAVGPMAERQSTAAGP